MNTSLERVLSNLRKIHGLTQVELAERLYTSQPSIARWENSRHDPRITVWQDWQRHWGKSLYRRSRKMQNLLSSPLGLTVWKAENAMLTHSRVQETLQGRKGA